MPLSDDGAPQTFADQLVIALALDLAESAAVLPALAAQSWVRRAPLACLYTTHALPLLPRARRGARGAVTAHPRRPSGRGRADQGAEPFPRGARADGRAQGALLDPLVSTAVAARRWDALRFLLESALLEVEPGPLDPTSALSARAEAMRQQVAPHRAIAAIAATYRRARLVGFVDDDYDDAQKTVRALSPWEPLFAGAEARVRAAEGLEDLR